MWDRSDWELFSRWLIMGAPAAVMIGIGIAWMTAPIMPVGTPPAIVVVEPTETETIIMPRHALVEKPSTIPPPPESPEMSITPTPEVDPDPEETAAPEAPETPQPATTSPVAPTTTTPVEPTTTESIQPTASELDPHPIYDALVYEYIDRDPLNSAFVPV